MPESTQDFVWTWSIFLNLALIIVVLPAVSALIVRSIKKYLDKQEKSREEQATEIKRLVAERDEEKEKVVMHWRDTYVQNQQMISQQVADIAKAIALKLDKKEHAETCQADELWERLNKHCHDSKGNVVIPR